MYNTIHIHILPNVPMLSFTEFFSYLVSDPESCTAFNPEVNSLSWCRCFLAWVGVCLMVSLLVLHPSCSHLLAECYLDDSVSSRLRTRRWRPFASLWWYGFWLLKVYYNCFKNFKWSGFVCFWLFGCFLLLFWFGFCFLLFPARLWASWGQKPYLFSPSLYPQAKQV